MLLDKKKREERVESGEWRVERDCLLLVLLF
jgi:hypothetical protein